MIYCLCPHLKHTIREGSSGLSSFPLWNSLGFSFMFKGLKVETAQDFAGFSQGQSPSIPSTLHPRLSPLLICSHPYFPSLVCGKALTSKAILEFQRAILIREMRNAETKESSQRRPDDNNVLIKCSQEPLVPPQGL